VLGADVIVLQAASLVAREEEHLLDAFGESIVHRWPP